MYEVLSAYLENGLRVVMHKLPNTKTVSCGIWIKQGSKYEQDCSNGLSHLIEHLLVSPINTNNNYYKSIMKEIELNGVQYNATTTKEHTHYYYIGLSNMLEIILDALANIVIKNRDISIEKFKLEKDIVKQEILSYYSSFNQITERTSQALWGNIDIGRIIVGNKQNIEYSTYEDIREIIESSYTPENSTLVIVGDIEYNKVLSLVEEKFNAWKDVETRAYEEVVNSSPGIYINNENKGKTTAISIGFRLENNYKEKIIPIEIISTILGSPSLDSRIIKKIRIEKGLAYSLNSFISKYSTKGTLAFTALTSNENVEEVIKLLLDEISIAKENFFTEKEIIKAKNKLETQAILKMNDLEKHLKFLGNCSINNETFSLENEIRMIKKCSNELLRSTMNELFCNENIGLAAIGKFDSNKIVDLLSI